MWVERTSPVARSVTVTVVSSTRIRKRGVGVVDADAELVHAAGASEAELAEAVDAVVADAPVAGVGVVGG